MSGIEAVLVLVINLLYLCPELPEATVPHLTPLPLLHNHSTSQLKKNPIPTTSYYSHLDGCFENECFWSQVPLVKQGKWGRKMSIIT